MSNNFINIDSDVVANPTNEMCKAMAAHEMGEYLDNGDRSVLELERLGAEVFAKEASIFLPTVTMGNLIACMFYCRPGEQILLDQDAHVYRHELGGMTRLAGALPRVLPRSGAMPDLKAVERAISHRSALNETPTKLAWVENTHNTGGGAVASVTELKKLQTLVSGRGIAIYADGARIFNAAVALGIPVAELTSPIDSISVSFNKAMACPFGCLLIGSRALIEAAGPLRRMLGGRMVKSGAVAAACRVALTTMVDRIAEDHAHARQIGEAIQQIPGLRLDSPVVTNIVRFDTSALAPAPKFVDLLAKEGVLMGAVGRTSVRAVTHHELTHEKTCRVIDVIGRAAASLAPDHARDIRRAIHQ